MKVRPLAAAVVAGILLSSTSRADDEPETPPPTVDPAFRYTTSAAPRYGRAAVENAIVLGLGYAQYTQDKANARDWDLSYDWRSMRSKLVLDSVSMDDNRFPTNWVTHPAAGLAYYTTARSNRLGVLPAFALTAASSTLWEYVGEWKEQVSINDVIVTPLAGMTLGEPLLQIGALMHRSRQTTATRAFGWVFAPFKSLHDGMDDLEPAEDERLDDLGLAGDGYHRFRLRSAVGITHQSKGVTQGDLRLAADSRIVSLQDYFRDGRHRGWFESAEATDFAATFTVSEASRITDFRVQGSLVPAGYRQQDVRVDDAGHLQGSSFLGGLELALEYGTHDYDRDGRRPVDRIALVGGGAELEEIVHVGGVSIRGRLDLLGSFAGVDAYALPEYRRAFSDLRLTSVLRTQHYYHGYGGTIRPELDLTAGRVRLGGYVRLDYFNEITSLDVHPTARPPESPSSDRRIWSRAFVELAATRHLRVSLSGELRRRDGTMPGATATRSELASYFDVDLVF